MVLAKEYLSPVANIIAGLTVSGTSHWRRRNASRKEQESARAEWASRGSYNGCFSWAAKPGHRLIIRTPSDAEVACV